MFLHSFSTTKYYQVIIFFQSYLSSNPFNWLSKNKKEIKAIITEIISQWNRIEENWKKEDRNYSILELYHLHYLQYINSFRFPSIFIIFKIMSVFQELSFFCIVHSPRSTLKCSSTSIIFSIEWIFFPSILNIDK